MRNCLMKLADPKRPTRLLFLLLCISQPANSGRPETEDRALQSQAGPESSGLKSDEQFFTAYLRKRIDAKKVKPGDAFTAGGITWISHVPSPVTFLGRIVEARALGRGTQESLIVLHIEKGILESKQELPLTLTLKAVAAPVTDQQ